MTWRSTRLRDILPFKYGKGLPERERSESGEFAVVSSAGIVGSHREALTRRSSVVIGRKGTIGAAYYCPHPVWPIDTTFFVEGSEDVDIRFGYYLLRSLPLSQMNNDSAVPGLNRTQAEALVVQIPDPPEQRAITATLGALDDKIESNRRAVTIAEQVGDALFAAVASESRLLSDVADITMGTSPKGADLNEDGDGLPFYQGTRDFGVRFPSLRVWTTAPVRTAAKSDTLMSVRAPVGELNRASADCCIGRGVAAIHSDTHPSTLYYAMRSSSSAWDKFQGEGTVFASVNKTDVHGAEIRWVGDGALLELEDKLRVIDARIESLESETQRLTALRDVLLPELLSGRIRVPAEGVVA